MPKGPSKIVTAIYIVADKYLDLAQVQATPKGYSLLKFARVKIPTLSPTQSESAQAVVSGEEDFQNAISDAITTALDRSAITTKNISTALSADNVLMRCFQMPRIPSHEWENAIKFEAQRHIPFKIDEVASRFKVLNEKDKNASTMDVFFAAAKKEIIDFYCKVFTKAGLNLESIDMAPLALVKVFKLNGQLEEDKVSIIVNVNNIKNANICVVKSNVPYFTRDVELELQEDATLEKLISEIRLLEDYSRRQFPRNPINKLILCGESEFEGWIDFLKTQLDMNIELGDVAKGIEEATELSYKQAIVIGIALNKLEKSTLEINLAPVVVKAVKIKAAPLIAVAILGALFILWMFSLTMLHNLGAVKKKLDIIKAGQPNIEASIKALPLEGLEGFKNRLSSETTFLEMLFSKRISVSDELKSIATILPQEAWLESLTLENSLTVSEELKVSLSNILNLDGYVFSQEKDPINLVNSLIDDIKRDSMLSKIYKDIQLVSASKEKIEIYDVIKFSIKCSTK